MNITQIKKSKKIKITYEEGWDTKIIESHEIPRREFFEAFNNLALAFKIELAKNFYDTEEKIREFLDMNILTFNTITLLYSEAGEDEKDKAPALCKVCGHHTIKGTDYDTDIKLIFIFGNDASPNKEITTLIKEAEAYIKNKRGEANLFEEDE